MLTQHLATKLEQAILTHAKRDGWEIAFCLRTFLLVNVFW